ncbi:MAG: hypothetical protein JWM95_2405 [Gemmatimonadetes bacterium]|nr:hypothetical protein [Gemmatimonadota bacterium]
MIVPASRAEPGEVTLQRPSTCTALALTIFLRLAPMPGGMHRDATSEIDRIK